MALRDTRSYEVQIIDAVRSVNKALGGTYGTSSAIYQSDFNQYEVQLIDAIKGIARTLSGSGLSVYGGANIDASGLVTHEEFDALTRRVSKLEDESFFRLVDGNVTLKAEYSNLWVPGWLAAGGIGSGSGGGSNVSVTQILTSGTAIATITVDGVDTTLYAPSGGSGSGSVNSVKLGNTEYTPDVNGVVSLPAYPSSLSQLSADSTHRLVTDTQISAWTAKQDAINDLSTIRAGAALGMTAVQYETDPTVPSWAKQSTKPTYTFSEITSKPTTIAGYGITDAKFGTAGSDYIPITLGSTTTNVLTAHQSLTAITNRLDAIETWFEVVNVGTQASPVYALHAKNGYAIYSDSWVAAGGVGSGSGGGGGFDLSRMWASLTNSVSDAYATTKINVAHIPSITTSYISNLETWISGKNYLTSSDLSNYALKTGGSGYDFRVNTLKLSASAYLSKGTLASNPRPAWTYTDSSTIPSSQVTKYLAYTDEIPSTLDDIADGSTRKLSDYVTLATAQEISGAKTFKTSAVTLDAVNLLPKTNLTCSLGTASYRFSDIYTNVADVRGSVSLRSSSTGYKTGQFSGQGGYLTFQTGANIESSYKQLTFHPTYGFYPETTGDINLGYATKRWANIYGVDADLTGDLTMTATSSITIGPVTIEYDANHAALHIHGYDWEGGRNIGLYCDGWVAAGGIGQSNS